MDKKRDRIFSLGQKGPWPHACLLPTQVTISSFAIAAMSAQKERATWPRNFFPSKWTPTYPTTPARQLQLPWHPE